MEVSSSVPASVPQLSTLTTTSPLSTVKQESTAAEKSPKWPKCTKTYNSKWENDPLLKTWIARHPRDNGKVVCRFCQSIIRAHKNDLLEHTRTLKHQRNFMQNSSPEEYNQFVMELNELRKEANAISKKRSNNVTAPTPEVKAPVYLTSVTTANSTSVTTSSTTTISSNAFLNLSSNSNGVLGDVLDNEELWQDGDEFMNAESPSDLVSVILEEQQSPTSTSTTVSSGSCPNSNNITLAPMTLSINGINMNVSLGTSALTTTTQNASLNPSLADNSANVIQTDTLNDTIQPSVTLQSYTIENDDRVSFTSNDVIRAIHEGSFNFRELCAIAKAVTTQLEYSYLLSGLNDIGPTNQNINSINGCATAVNSITSNSVTLSTASCILPAPTTPTPQLTENRANQIQNTTSKIVPGRNMRKRKAATTAT